MLIKITFEEFNKSISEIKKELFINALFYGNVKADNLNIIKNNLVINTQMTSSNQTLLDKFTSVYKIPSSYVYRFNNDLKTELNHFIANYYQIGLRDVKQHLITSLLELTWGNTFYHQLRTVKQYGYIVYGGKSIMDNVMVK